MNCMFRVGPGSDAPLARPEGPSATKSSLRYSLRSACTETPEYMYHAHRTMLVAFSFNPRHGGYKPLLRMTYCLCENPPEVPVRGPKVSLAARRSASGRQYRFTGRYQQSWSNTRTRHVVAGAEPRSRVAVLLWRDAGARDHTEADRLCPRNRASGPLRERRRGGAVS